MNCEDFQKAIGAEPQSPVEGGDAHVATCASCRQLREDYLELDRQIRKALSVPVPEFSLPSINDQSTVETLKQPRRPATPLWFGLAATIALAAWVGLQLQEGQPSRVLLADQIVAHMDHEAESRVASSVAVPEQRLFNVVNNGGVQLDRDVGLITYARSCEINGKSVPHLVIQGRNGPVTLLLMPDEPVDGVTPLAGNAINGVILPHGNGSIAIIAERDEPLAEIEQRVMNAVQWTT